MGEHGLWQKMSLFEGSTRIPLLIIAPGTSQAGGVAESPVSHIDLYPTLCELAGVKSPANLQGQSLVPLLKDPRATGRGWALTQVTRGRAARKANPSAKAMADGVKAKAAGAKVAAAGAKAPAGNRFFGYTLRTPRWRYTEWDEGRQGRELYDHQTDPQELTNLADRPDHAQTVAELSAQLGTAVKASFPPDGQTPQIPAESGLWAPLLVD